MKKLAVFFGVGLFVLIVAGMTIVFARGMSCHGSMAQSTMMRNAGPVNSNHPGMMGWMHRMHGNLSSWLNVSSFWKNDQTGTTSDRARNTGDESSKVLDTDGSTTDSMISIRTKFANRLAYQGVSDKIEWTVNPTLRVDRGEEVTIRLINSMGGTHNLAVPALGVWSKNLTKRGAETTFQFVPDKTGEFTYYCTIRGHRSAGMAGTIVVE